MPTVSRECVHVAQAPVHLLENRYSSVLYDSPLPYIASYIQIFEVFLVNWLSTKFLSSKFIDKTLACINQRAGHM